MDISKETILQLEQQLAKAIKASDLGFITEVLYDGLLFLGPEGQLITKEMDLAAHRSGAMIVEELEMEFEAFERMGDSAVSIVSYTTKGIMMGTPISGQFRYIRNWKAFGDGIKIISGCCLKVG